MTRPKEKLLNVREAAALLGIKPGSLYNWAAQRKVPSVKIFGALRFRQEDVNALIDAGMRNVDEAESFSDD